MSAYAEIYSRLGEAQARAAEGKAQLWSQAISNIGAIPQQVAQQSLQRAREQRLTQEAAQQQHLTQLKLQDAQDQRLDQSLTGQLVTANTTTDENGHNKTNHDAVYQG